MRIVGILLLGLLAGCAVPPHVYLTWQGDTATTMTVNFHTARAVPSVVYYDTVPRGGVLADYALRAEGTAHQVPGVRDGRWVHTVELRGLAPGGTVYFAVAEGDAPVARERRFHTLPDDGHPIRFIDGGDVNALSEAGKMLRAAAAWSPDFVSLGGDLAYENGNTARSLLYDRWLCQWEDAMVSPAGDTIPLMAAIGNHETNGMTGDPQADAPFYFGYFAQGGHSNFARRIGRDAVLLFLDSGHTQTWAAQVPWLDGALAANAEVPLKFATYHVPLYPSFRPFDGSDSAQGRVNWGPIFDAHALSIAFEHHDHTLKRTKPLRGGQVDAAGTIYLGDGCLGEAPRPPLNADAWYLEKTASVRHFWVVDIADATATCRAIGEDGAVWNEVAVGE